MSDELNPPVSNNVEPEHSVQPVADHPVQDSQTSNTPVAPMRHNHPLVYMLPVLLFAVFAGAVWMRSGNTSQNETANTQKTPEIAKAFVTVTSPAGRIQSVDGEILVSGKTLPNSSVLIYSDTDDSIVDSATDGSFETTVLVGQDGGLVRITAIGPSGDEASATVEVSANASLSDAGSTDVLGKSTAPGQEKKSDSGESKSQQNNNQDKGKPDTMPALDADTPKAKPTAAEKTTKTPKPEKPESSQESKPDVKTFVAKKTASKKPEKLGTEKIRERIREGTQSGKLARYEIRSMETKRASDSSTLKRHAVQGLVTAVDGNVITLTHQIQRDRITTVYFNVDTVITGKDITSDSSQISVGMRVAAVGFPSENGILATRIHIIPGKATGIFEKNPASTASGETETPTPESSISATLTPTETISASPSSSPVQSEN